MRSWGLGLIYRRGGSGVRGFWCSDNKIYLIHPLRLCSIPIRFSIVSLHTLLATSDPPLLPSSRKASAPTIFSPFEKFNQFVGLRWKAPTSKWCPGSCSWAVVVNSVHFGPKLSAKNGKPCVALTLQSLEPGTYPWKRTCGWNQDITSTGQTGTVFLGPLR